MIKDFYIYFSYDRAFHSGLRIHFPLEITFTLFALFLKISQEAGPHGNPLVSVLRSIQMKKWFGKEIVPALLQLTVVVIALELLKKREVVVSNEPTYITVAMQ